MERNISNQRETRTNVGEIDRKHEIPRARANYKAPHPLLGPPAPQPHYRPRPSKSAPGPSRTPPRASSSSARCVHARPCASAFLLRRQPQSSPPQAPFQLEAARSAARPAQRSGASWASWRLWIGRDVLGRAAASAHCCPPQHTIDGKADRTAFRHAVQSSLTSCGVVLSGETEVVPHRRNRDNHTTRDPSR